MGARDINVTGANPSAMATVTTMGTVRARGTASLCCHAILAQHATKKERTGYRCVEKPSHRTG